MKSSKHLAIAGLVSAIAFAQPSLGFTAEGGSVAAPAVERTLEEVMHDLGDLAKALAPQVANPAHNADSAEKTDKLRALAVEALPLTPEKVAKMPEEAARKIELLEYQKLISLLHVALTTLQIDFLKSDNTAAIESFKQVRALQKQGHDRFRSPQ